MTAIVALNARSTAETLEGVRRAVESVEDDLRSVRAVVHDTERLPRRDQAARGRDRAPPAGASRSGRSAHARVGRGSIAASASGRVTGALPAGRAGRQRLTRGDDPAGAQRRNDDLGAGAGERAGPPGRAAGGVAPRRRRRRLGARRRARQELAPAELSLRSPGSTGASGRAVSPRRPRSNALPPFAGQIAPVQTVPALPDAPARLGFTPIPRAL